jgi:hypothetical protein
MNYTAEDYNRLIGELTRVATPTQKFMAQGPRSGPLR